MRALIDGMVDVLVAAASGPSEADVGAVRQLIDLLTGGRIEVAQAGESRAKGGWLRGQFRCPLIEVVTERLGSRPAVGSGPELVTVEYRVDREADPSVARRVMELYDRGLLVKQTARDVDLSRAAVAAVIDGWFARAGRDRPDGRVRRSALADKHVEPPVYRAMADSVKALADRGKLFGKIGNELGLDRNTVTAAWRHWHESRGLPVPDGRGRRKTLTRKSNSPDGGTP